MTTEPVVETPAEISSPPSEETSEGTGLVFETPDFSAITDFVESDGEEETPVEAVVDEAVIPVEETPPEEPAAPVVVSEGEVTPEVEVAPVIEAEAPAEAAPEEPVVEPVKMPTQEELQGLYKEHREKMLPQLTEIFELSEEEASALDEQPSKIIPKLAGQMMYDTMLSTYNAVLTALPGVVQTYITASKQADTAQLAFYEAWPELDNAKAAPVVTAAIQAYRAANPRSPLADVIQNTGVMAMINLGLDPLRKKEQETPAPKLAVVPARPVSPGGSTQITPPTPKGQPANMFDELTAVIEEELK